MDESRGFDGSLQLRFVELSPVQDWRGGGGRDGRGCASGRYYSSCIQMVRDCESCVAVDDCPPSSVVQVIR